MNHLKIQNTTTGVRFILQQKEVPFFVKVILLLITIITAAVPIGVLFFATEIDILIMIGASVCVFLTFIVLKMFLWNSFGKEVFEIDKEKIFHYTDYRFFKDKLLEQDRGTNIRFERMSVFLNQIEKESALLDAKEDFEKQDFVFVISDHEKELTRSNIKLSHGKVGEMLEVLKT